MKILDGRKTFFQWDVKAKITSSKFKAGDMIHFGNGTTPETVTVKAYELNGQVVADVPNGMLQSASDICVYHYRWDTDGSGRTLQAQSFGVCARPKPVDYALTETEVIGYGLLDKRVSELEKNGGGSGTPGRGIDHIEINENGELVIYYTDGTSDNLGVITGGGDTPEDEPEEGQLLLEAGTYKFNSWTPTEAEFSQELNYEVYEPDDYYPMIKIAFVDGVLNFYNTDGGFNSFDEMYDNQIYVREAQYVSKTFYDWLMENATLVVELPIGMYSFNDSLTEAEFEQNLSYDVYEGTYEQMSKIRAFYEDGVWKLQFIYAWDGMSFTELKYMDEKAIHINQSGQYVPKTFYDWLMANTTH